MVKFILISKTSNTQHLITYSKRIFLLFLGRTCFMLHGATKDVQLQGAPLFGIRQNLYTLRFLALT